MHSNHERVGHERAAIEIPSRSGVGAVGIESVAALTDDALLAGTRRLVCVSNRVLAVLLAHLAEVEARGLHRQRACASLYTYCIYELRMPEDTAYRRVAAARLVKRFPQLLVAVERGELHLTGVLLLGPHLTETNIAGVLERARFRTNNEILKLVRLLSPLPDVPSRIEPLGLARPAHPFSRPTWSNFVASFCPVRELPPDERPSNWLPSEETEIGALELGAQRRSPELEPNPVSTDVLGHHAAGQPAPARAMPHSPSFDPAPARSTADSTPPDPLPPKATSHSTSFDPALARAMPHSTSLDPAPARAMPHSTSFEPAAARSTSNSSLPDPATAWSRTDSTFPDHSASLPARVHLDGSKQDLSGPQRYKVQFTAGEEYVALVEEAKALLAHALPSADLAEIHLRALRGLVAAIKKRKFAKLAPLSEVAADLGSRSSGWPGEGSASHAAAGANLRSKKAPALSLDGAPRRESEQANGTGPTASEAGENGRHTPGIEQLNSHAASHSDRQTKSPRQGGRHVPAAVRRAVFERDGNRCAYVDDRGVRCRETSRLELHHREPFARGGPSTPENLALYCAAHNALAAEQDFGSDAKREHHPHLIERALTLAKRSRSDLPI